MATVDFNVQFWAPPSNPFPHKQRSASSHSTSKSTYTTSSRNPPAPLHNQAARIFKRNDQSTSAISAARHQGDDSVARAQGRNNDPTNRDDKTGGGFPSIKKLISQISHEGISTRGCRDLEDTLQYLKEPTLDTSGSCPSLTQSRLDNSIDGSQGTRDMHKPVILEDDDTPTPNPEATTEPSKPTNPSSDGRWYNIEDGDYINDNFRPIPLLKQEGLASIPTPAQGQPHPRHHSLKPLQDQINQYSNNGTIRRTLEEPGPYSLSTPLDENGGGGSEEKTVSELEKDLLLAFEEQEKPSFAPAPSSPRPHHPSAEPFHPQIDPEHDQEHDESGRLEGLRRSTPLRSQDQEEPQEQQQRQEVAVEAIREDKDDGDNEEREPQGEKH